MKWEALGVIASTALSLAAFLVSLRGLRHARRSADAAERSAQAAERSAPRPGSPGAWSTSRMMATSLRTRAGHRPMTS